MTVGLNTNAAVNFCGKKADRKAAAGTTQALSADTAQINKKSAKKTIAKGLLITAGVLTGAATVIGLVKNKGTLSEGITGKKALKIVTDGFKTIGEKAVEGFKKAKKFVLTHLPEKKDGVEVPPAGIDGDLWGELAE